MSEIVPNIVHFNEQYRKIVQELVQIRKEAGQNQSDMADWLGLDRRKIIALEACSKIDMETLLMYAHKLSVEIKLNYQIH